MSIHTDGVSARSKRHTMHFPFRSSELLSRLSTLTVVYVVAIYPWMACNREARNRIRTFPVVLVPQWSPENRPTKGSAQDLVVIPCRRVIRQSSSAASHAETFLKARSLAGMLPLRIAASTSSLLLLAVGSRRQGRITMIFGRKVTREYKGKLQTVIEDLDLPNPVIRSITAMVSPNNGDRKLADEKAARLTASTSASSMSWTLWCALLDSSLSPPPECKREQNSRLGPHNGPKASHR